MDNRTKAKPNFESSQVEETRLPLNQWQTQAEKDSNSDVPVTMGNHVNSAKTRMKEEADHLGNTSSDRPPETPTADSLSSTEQKSSPMPSDANSSLTNDSESQDSAAESKIDLSSISDSGRLGTPATSVSSSESSSNIWTEKILQNFRTAIPATAGPDESDNQQHFDNPQEEQSTQHHAIDTLESHAKKKAGSTRYQKEAFEIVDWLRTFYDETSQKLPSIDAEEFSLNISESLSAQDMFNSLFVRCDVSARFRDFPEKCLANNKKGDRCKSPVKDVNVSAIGYLLDEMEGEYEASKSIDMLKQLARIAICWHHSTLAQEQIALLSADIEIRGHGKALIGETAREQENLGLSNPDNLEETGYPVEGNDMTRTPDIKVGFEPYSPLNTQVKPKHQFMEEILREPLTQNEEESGYIYLYRNDVYAGMGKIGKTTGDVGKRLKEWERRCKRLVRADFRSEHSPHVGRIETLIHADLTEMRFRTSRCSACSTVHKEWFQIDDPESVKKIIIKWTTWMNRQPYEEKDGKWRLKTEFEDDVREMRKKWREEGRARSRSSQRTHSYNLRPRISGNGSSWIFAFSSSRIVRRETS